MVRFGAAQTPLTAAQLAQFLANASLSAPVPVRQTVLSGPAASGAPSFLPASSGNLTLTFQNISTVTPLVLTCAKGFGIGGPVDPLAVFTANPSITVPASAVSFPYYDFDAAAWSSGTLVPIYQFGGAISTVAGQFTFDWQSMLGWVGNGSIATRANRVYVGELTASATAITSIAAYAYQGRYESPWTNGIPGAGITSSASHYIGVQPQIRRVTVENTLAENGYIPGDQVSSDGGLTTSNGSYLTPPTVAVGRMSISWATNASGVYVLSKSAANTFVALGSSWRWRLQPSAAGSVTA